MVNLPDAARRFCPIKIPHDCISGDFIKNPQNKARLFLSVCGRRNNPSTLRLSRAPRSALWSFFSPHRLSLQPVRPLRMWWCPPAQLLSPPFSRDSRHTTRTHSSKEEGNLKVHGNTQQCFVPLQTHPTKTRKNHSAADCRELEAERCKNMTMTSPGAYSKIILKKNQQHTAKGYGVRFKAHWVAWRPVAESAAGSSVFKTKQLLPWPGADF